MDDKKPEDEGIPKGKLSKNPNVFDLKDVREDIENLKVQLTEQTADVKKLNDLVVQLLGGFESKVIPMLDSHEAIIKSLPDSLTSSFTKQSELMKTYIDNRLKPPIDVPNGQGQTAAAAPNKDFFGQLIDYGRQYVEKQGGIGNVLKGNNNEGEAVVKEIGYLEKEWINRARLEFRDLLREALKLPGTPSANAPVKVIAP